MKVLPKNRRMRKRCHAAWSKAGFTLIETIVAFAIIAIILVVALVGFNTIANVDIKSQQWNEADEGLQGIIAQGTGFKSAQNFDLMLTITSEETAHVYIVIPGVIQTFEENGKTMNIFRELSSPAQ